MSDMDSKELRETLTYLGVEPGEAAQLLGVAPRTMRRWLYEGEEIPGPAIVALRAWRAMHIRRLSWKPDMAALFEDDQDQIERHREHIIDLDKALASVEARGGPAAPWVVDLSKCMAISGPYEVGFYRLKSNSFSLSNYRHREARPDLARDRPFLEDAAYCIGKAFEKAAAAPAALNAVARYTRENSTAFVTDGPKMMTPTQRAKRKQEIEALADKIDALADDAVIGKASYKQFEDILTKLHAAGFFPLPPLVSAVAKSM